MSARVCEVCGREFEQTPGTRPMKYCSTKCARRAETIRRSKDSEFKARKRALAAAYRKTAKGLEKTREAVLKYRAKKRAELGSQTWRSETRTCAVCGVAFNPSRPNQVCCSRACYAERNRAKHRVAETRRTCPVCGTVFDFGGKRRKYCSDACRIIERNAKARLSYAGKSSGKSSVKRRVRRVGTSAAMRSIQLIRQVERDVMLPPAERYKASQKWTKEQHAHARRLYEKHNGLFSSYRPMSGFNTYR